MRVLVNDEIRDFPEGISLAELLSLQEIKSFSGMALAVNNNVIRKDEWAHTILCENDRVLIITATKGG